MPAFLVCAERRVELAQKRSLAERRAVHGTAPHEALPTPLRRLAHRVAPQALSPLPSREAWLRAGPAQTATSPTRATNAKVVVAAPSQKRSTYSWRLAGAPTTLTTTHVNPATAMYPIVAAIRAAIFCSSLPVKLLLPLKGVLA